MASRKLLKISAEVARWRAKLEPKLPDIDPEDLHLILWSMLRLKHGIRPTFLLRKNRDGTGFVF